MEFIKLLLGLLFRLALAAIVIAVVAWVVGTFFPQYTPKNALHSITSLFHSSDNTDEEKTTSTSTVKKVGKSWLPDPGSVKLASTTTPTATTNLYVSNSMYVHGEPYNGQTNTYGTTYTSTSSSAGDQRELYVRNLSLPSYGYIFSGMTIIGEAKENMFSGGTFPLIIVDDKGRTGVIGKAVATTNWAIPGWIKFEARITSRLPNNVPCTLIFESQEVQPIMKRAIRINYPVRCQ